MERRDSKAGACCDQVDHPRRKIRALQRVLQTSSPSAQQDAVTQLVALAQQGDTVAEGAVITWHQPRIERLIRCMWLPRADTEDLVQVGFMAMRRPIERFDARRGTPLWAYARHFVKGAIVDDLGRNAGLTPHETRLYKPVRAARDSLADRSGGAEPDSQAVLAEFRRRHGCKAGMTTVAAILDVLGGRVLLAGDPEMLRLRNSNSS